MLVGRNTSLCEGGGFTELSMAHARHVLIEIVESDIAIKTCEHTRQSQPRSLFVRASPTSDFVSGFFLVLLSLADAASSPRRFHERHFRQTNEAFEGGCQAAMERVYRNRIDVESPPNVTGEWVSSRCVQTSLAAFNVTRSHVRELTLAHQTRKRR